MKKRTGFWFKPLLVAMLLASLALAGCEGDDGSNGTPGTPGASAYEIAVENGFTGTEAEWLAMISGSADATTADIETCAVCHASVEAIHAATDVASVVTNSAELNAGGDFVINFDVMLNGLPNNNFTLRRAYVNYDDPALQTTPPTLITTFVRAQLTPVTDIIVASLPGGNYTATIPALSPNFRTNGTYLVQLEDPSGSSSERPVVVAVNGTSQLRDLVTSDACAKCHGPYPAWGKKFKHYAVGGSECQICHSQGGTNPTTGLPLRGTTFISKDAANAFVEVGPIAGTNLTEYIHGIHNSHNMPDGIYYRTTSPDGAANIEDRYAIGFPSDMRNCSVCHSTPPQFSGVAAAPISYYLCMTCHNNWDGFVHLHDDTAATPAFLTGDPIFTPSDFHRSLTLATDCMQCHAATPALDEVSDFHNDFQGTDAHYDSFYRGEDISYSNNDNLTVTITGVTTAGPAVSFTWTASKLGAAVDPCNTTIATGPTYEELGAYLAYAKGDDWVNEFVGTSPGQPEGAKNLFTSLATTCAANVATTTGLTLDAEALVYADKVLLAIGGKPLDTHAATGNTYFVREPSPTYAFDPATGAAVPERRNAVDNDKCLGCHQGTLYQHGGDRVDNEQLCVVCHNPSSGDKNNRLDRFQIVNADGTVNTAATYDGKNNETYDMRTMIHAIHGVDKRNDPWVIYRSRGIYAFVPALFEEVAFDPTNAPDDFDTVEVAFPFPAGWPTDGETINGSTNASTIAHNWTVVHYPKPISECSACHNDEAYEAPDQTKAVALTVDPGADYADQSDDIVIGPTAAACTACHATAPVMTHATVDFGYKANVTKEEMLEKAAQ